MSATLTYPPGGTFFDTIKLSFSDVPLKDGDAIPTTEFLEAAESLTALFGTSAAVQYGKETQWTDATPDRCLGICCFHTCQGRYDWQHQGTRAQARQIFS